MTDREFAEHSFAFGDRLTAAQKELLFGRAKSITYKKGTHVYGAAEDCLGVILLKNGQFRVYIVSEDGREITLYRLYGGEFCVLAASCVLDAITFDVFIDAEEDSEAILIDVASFNRVMEENIYAEAFVYKMATERFSDVMWAMQQILFMGADRRLAIFLCDESAKNGSDEIRLTHERIAKYMGSAREVVSRMLGYFESEGVVSLSRRSIRIADRKKLKEIAGIA